MASIILLGNIEHRKGTSPLAAGGSESDYTDEGIKGNLKCCYMPTTQHPRQGDVGAETR